MYDYMLEAYIEMAEYLGIPLEELLLEAPTTSKDGVYKTNYYLRDHLQVPYITPKLSKEATREKIIENVSQFMDDHNKELTASGPFYSIPFGTTNAEFLYTIFGITPDMVKEMYDKMVQETFYGKISKFFTSWVYNAPHKLILTAMMMDAIQHKYEDILECAEYMWAFTEYSLVFVHYWRQGVRQDVMEYTIEHLGSKFTIKKFKSMQGILKYDAHKCVESFYERFKDGADNHYTDFMQRAHNQYNHRYGAIAHEYYDNIEKNATQHTQISTFDDGTAAEQSGIGTNIARAVDTTNSKLIGAPVNESIATAAAQGSQVDKDNLIGFLNQIISTKNNRMPKLVENIITLYFNSDPTATSIDSGFPSFGLKLYRSIGTSKDPLMVEIKSILAYWVNDIINLRQFYKREQTIIAYNRALFNYIIFMIVITNGN